jgi:hypothetical protein
MEVSGGGTDAGTDAGTNAGGGLDERVLSALSFLMAAQFVLLLKTKQSGRDAVGATYENLAACFVTAATTPPTSLLVFLSFLPAIAHV